MKVTPCFKLEEVSPPPLAGPGLQASKELVDAGWGWGGVGGGGMCTNIKKGVLGILNTLVPDLPGTPPAPFSFSR